jgi:hypothetical protein
VNLAFDADKHEYRLDGNVVPSVTQVLAPLYDLDRIPRDVLERKRQIGVALDEIIVLDCADDLDESTVDPELVGYLEAFRRFRVDKKFIPAAMQQRVYSKTFRFAGTPDAWGSIEGHDALADWKATYAMHPAVALQTAGYAMAGHEMGALKTSIRRYGVQFCPDGRYNISPYESKQDWGTFLSFLSCHSWRARNGLLKEKA